MRLFMLDQWLSMNHAAGRPLSTQQLTRMKLLFFQCGFVGTM